MIKVVLVLKEHVFYKIVEHVLPRKVNLQDDLVCDWPDMSKVYFSISDMTWSNRSIINDRLSLTDLLR